MFLQRYFIQGLTMGSGMDLTEVQKLADRAHEIRPYSRATRGNIPVEVVAVEA